MPGVNEPAHRDRNGFEDVPLVYWLWLTARCFTVCFSSCRCYSCQFQADNRTATLFSRTVARSSCVRGFTQLRKQIDRVLAVAATERLFQDTRHRRVPPARM